MPSELHCALKNEMQARVSAFLCFRVGRSRVVRPGLSRTRCRIFCHEAVFTFLRRDAGGRHGRRRWCAAILGPARAPGTCGAGAAGVIGLGVPPDGSRPADTGYGRVTDGRVQVVAAASDNANALGGCAGAVRPRVIPLAPHSAEESRQRHRPTLAMPREASQSEVRLRRRRSDCPSIVQNPPSVEARTAPFGVDGDRIGTENRHGARISSANADFIRLLLWERPVSNSLVIRADSRSDRAAFGGLVRNSLLRW